MLLDDAVDVPTVGCPASGQGRGRPCEPRRPASSQRGCPRTWLRSGVPADPGRSTLAGNPPAGRGAPVCPRLHGPPLRQEWRTAELTEKLLAAAGQPVDLIHRKVFPLECYDSESLGAISLCGGLRGYGSRLALQKEIVNDALTNESAHVRALSLGLFETLDIPIAPFLDRIVRMATEPAMTVCVTRRHPWSFAGVRRPCQRLERLPSLASPTSVAMPSG